MKKYARVLRLLLIVFTLLSANVFADLEIIVEPNTGWGNARTSNIKRLCENVALHFQEQLRDEHKIDGDLTIVYRSAGPIAYYRSFFDGAADEYKIGLKVTGTYWDNFSYQFGHEFCHILHNHDLFEENHPDPNGWFREAICEMANLWVIRRMSETWEHRPPYQNWVDYRHALSDYANNWMMSRPEVQYDGTGAEWLAEWEDKMRIYGSADFTYARVSQLSYKFLTIFEENPEAWNAVRQMPTSTSKMSDYMKDWYNVVDTQDKEFVKAIATEMGITVEIEPVTAVVIDADVNDDGYVDLFDVLIVRSGMNAETSYDTDINNDGVTDEIDLLIVKAIAIEAIAKAAPSKRKTRITTWGAIKKAR